MIFSLLLVTVSQISAVELSSLITRDQIQLDEVLADSTPVPIRYPSKLYITQVVSPNTVVASDSETWVQHLYYYFVTRSGLTDIPFTYLVDRDGNIYQGLKKGDGASPFLEDSEGAILVGYLSNGADYTNDAVDAFKSLVETASQKYGLTRKDVIPVDLTLNKSDNALSYISVNQSTMKFAKNIESKLNQFEYSEGADIQFEASLSKDSYSFDSKAGELVNISIDVTNSGQTPWYLDRFDVYLETANGKDSSYAVNGEWESFQKVLLVEKEDGIVKPGEVVRLSFKMQAPLLAGTYKEAFRLKILDGSVVTGSEFNVSFNASKGDFTLIQITDTETGSLNVRKGPYISADSITKVAVGRIYISQDTEAGWYKIEYSAGKFGWVYGKYTKVVQ